MLPKLNDRCTTNEDELLQFACIEIKNSPKLRKDKSEVGYYIMLCFDNNLMTLRFFTTDFILYFY